MNFFNQYPYLNINDLNLDFILNAIKEMRNEVINFVSINAIKYADPIQWNITRQYEKNTIVIDPVTGTAYISVAPVPSGVALTRPEYWTVVFDLQSFVTKANQNLANNYEEQTTTTATMNTNAGAWIIWGDVLYKALVNITAGDAYVVGSNIQRITIEDVINAIVQNIAEEVQTLRGAINDEVQARQDADTALSDRIDDEVQARQDADAALQDAVDDLERIVSNSYTSTDDLSSSAFIAAFENDVITDLAVGVYYYDILANGHRYAAVVVKQDATHKSIFVSSYSNSDTGGIVGVWNYNSTSAQWVFNRYPTVDDIPSNDLISEYYRGKKVLILGDSLSSPGKVWVNKFTEFVESLGGTVTNWAVNAYTSADMYNKLNTETAQNFDRFIMWIGQNDYNQHVMPGNTGAAFDSSSFGYSVENSLLLLISKFGNPEGALVGIHWSIRQGYTGKKLGRREWSRISFYCAKKYGHTFIDMNKAPLIGWGQDPDVWTIAGDNVHFNDAYQNNYLWQFLAKSAAEKNDGLVGIDTEYNINNAPNMFTPATGVSVYRHFLDVEDTGYAHLYMILQTTAQLTPSSGMIVLGTWNFDIFSNYETSITAIDSTNKKVYDGILIHGNNGQLRLYTADTIPSGATLQLRAPQLKTNQLTFYTPTEL